MDVATELHSIHGRLRQSLQAPIGQLNKLCEEAERAKSSIESSGNRDCFSIAEIERVVNEATASFSEKAHALNKAAQAEVGFSQAHNLTNKHHNKNAVISFLMIAIGVFAESAVNASFFLSASLVASPVMALVISFLISLTNAMCSAFGGFFIGRFRYYGAQAVDPNAPEFKTIRIKAAIKFYVFLIVMIFFILTIGLIRSTESLDRVEHSLFNYGDLLVTPEALFLMMINVCIAVFAYHKGKTGFVHPYGDYSDYQHAVEIAQDALYDAYEDAAADIEAVFDDIEDTNEKSSSAQSKAVKAYNKQVTECLNAHRALEQAIREAENQFSTAVTRVVNTQSVITGKSENLSAETLQQFSFSDIGTVELPSFYEPPNNSEEKTALAEAKANALKRLSETFEAITQQQIPD